jgi:hypothetical protein
MSKRVSKGVEFGEAGRANPTWRVAVAALKHANYRNASGPVKIDLRARFEKLAAFRRNTPASIGFHLAQCLQFGCEYLFASTMISSWN